MAEHPTPEHRELRLLSRADSMELLTTALVGRVVMTANALPTALPVNYVVDGDAIVFRSGPGLKLDSADRGTVVAFEADHFDPQLRMGWSVVATGVARVLTDPADIAHAESLQIPTWAEPAPPTYVRIETGSVSGRWLVPTAVR